MNTENAGSEERDAYLNNKKRSRCREFLQRDIIHNICIFSIRIVRGVIIVLIFIVRSVVCIGMRRSI